MAGRVSLSKFNPVEIHNVMGADGRFRFKGKLAAGNLRPKKRKNAKPRPVKVVEPPALHPSDLDNLLNNPEGLQDKLGFTAKYKIKDLIVAIKEVEDEIAISADASPESLLIHFVRRAYKSDVVLKDLMKKLLPDLKHVEGEIDVNEKFQLIIDATGGDDDDDDIVDVKALPAPNVPNEPKRRNVKVKRRRKSA